MDSSVLTEMINLLTGGITGMAEGIGGGLSTLATKIMLEEPASGTGAATLSAFGGLICIMAGISLAVGLSRLVSNFVMHLGN